MVNEERRDARGEGTPSSGGDLAGPGTGGSPTGAGTGAGPDRDEAARERDVAALIENLRSDFDPNEAFSDADEAAREAGTGTDR